MVLNRGLLVLTRLRVTGAFLLFATPELFLRAWATGLRHLSSPRVRFLATILLFVTVTPSILFLRERSERRDREEMVRYLVTSMGSENALLRDTVKDLYRDRLTLRNYLLDEGFLLVTPSELHVKVLATAYSSTPIETDDTPFITASNKATRMGIIALSRDLLRPYTPDAPFGFGDRVWVEGLGEFVVEDSMNKRWRKRADIWFPSRSQALLFGKREIYLSKISDRRFPDQLSRERISD